MSNNNNKTFNVFSVSSASAGFQVDADYNFINEVKSPDESLSISNGTSFPVDITVDIEAHSSVQSILTFIKNPGEEDEGRHILTSNASEKGLVIADPYLGISKFPDYKAILIAEPGGGLGWLGIPADGNYVLGVRDGGWSWYAVETCQNSCD